MGKRDLDAVTSVAQRLAIEHGATQALAESDSLAEATPKIIATVCRTLGWRCGSCSVQAPSEGAPHCIASWGVVAPGVNEFLEATHTQREKGSPGGMRRRTWLTGEAVWVQDVTREESFRRGPAALKAGLHSAFACPIKTGDQVSGVLEFFSDRILEPDAGLLDCMRYVGSQIGQFIQRVEAQERLRQSEARFRSLLDLSSDWYWEQDDQFRLTFMSNRVGEKTGLNAASYLGRKRWDVPALNLSEADWERHRAQLARHEPFSDFEMQRPGTDGQTVWLSLSGEPIFDADGRFTGYRGIGRDITARKQAEWALRESEARFRGLTELSSDWYWEQDAELRFTKFEGNGLAGARYNPSAALLGKPAWDIPGVVEGSVDWAMHRARVTRREPFRELEYAYRNRSGKQYFVSVSGEPMFDADGGFAGYRGTSRDITERKHAEERIQYLATHDALTELPNRVMFGQLLHHAIDGAQRYKRSFAVLFIDLDRFKVINDTLGHEAGDELLRAVAARLRTTLRASDVVARLGGDEFVILVQEVSDGAQVSAVARKILSAVMKPLVIAGQECRVTASIGASMYPLDATDERSLMKNADMAMYLAKEEGKNTFQFYSKSVKSASLEKMALETALRRALERGEFSLHYQAKQDLKSGAITGVEALLRWQSADLGSISPAQFIPLAEETGLIVPIGKWVLRTACAQNVAWQRQGLPPVCMAVNLSPRQFADPSLVEDIAATCRETGMPASLLELEITEGMVMHNPERAIKILRAVKEMGVRLAIDDFGTGYSSLAQLKRFPIDTLKVDRSFIRDIPRDAEDKAITEAIIAMGKTLSLTVVAEGVETEEQQTFLREHACDQMQGYFFSKPVPPEQFAALLRKHSS